MIFVIQILLKDNFKVNIGIMVMNNMYFGFLFVSFLKPLEDTARYAGLLLAPAEGFSLRPRLFSPFSQKMAFYAVLAFLGHFCEQ